MSALDIAVDDKRHQGTTAIPFLEKRLDPESLANTISMASINNLTLIGPERLKKPLLLDISGQLCIFLLSHCWKNGRDLVKQVLWSFCNRGNHRCISLPGAFSLTTFCQPLLLGNRLPAWPKVVREKAPGREMHR